MLIYYYRNGDTILCPNCGQHIGVWTNHSYSGVVACSMCGLSSAHAPRSFEGETLEDIINSPLKLNNTLDDYVVYRG